VLSWKGNEFHGPKFTICIASVNSVTYVIHKTTLFHNILFISNLRKEYPQQIVGILNHNVSGDPTVLLRK
jgi:hypothetical protein